MGNETVIWSTAMQQGYWPEPDLRHARKTLVEIHLVPALPNFAKHLSPSGCDSGSDDAAKILVCAFVLSQRHQRRNCRRCLDCAAPEPLAMPRHGS